MKIWVTTHALTSGVRVVENADIDGGMASWQYERSYRMYAHGEGRDWHRTEAAANERVLELIDRKLVSLAKSREKMLSLRETFLERRKS